MARGAARAPRPVPRLAFRNHAAADDGQDGRALLPALPGALADVGALASAPLDEVLKAWAGLGYYARARNLHACARAVVEQHGGKFPASEAALRALPGIGAYTAAAIAAIAFDAPAAPVDGNVERVIARLFAVADAAAARPSRSCAAMRASSTPARRAGDFAQAMMDLGATICTPKTAGLRSCARGTTAAPRTARGEQETFPRRTPKREGALRRGAAFVVRGRTARCWCARGPRSGLLGGMTEVPTTDWMRGFRSTPPRSQARRVFPGQAEADGVAPPRRRGAPRLHAFPARAGGLSSPSVATDGTRLRRRALGCA